MTSASWSPASSYVLSCGDGCTAGETDIVKPADRYTTLRSVAIPARSKFGLKWESRRSRLAAGITVLETSPGYQSSTSPFDLSPAVVTIATALSDRGCTSGVACGSNSGAGRLPTAARRVVSALTS